MYTGLFFYAKYFFWRISNTWIEKKNIVYCQIHVHIKVLGILYDNISLLASI